MNTTIHVQPNIARTIPNAEQQIEEFRQSFDSRSQESTTVHWQRGTSSR